MEVIPAVVELGAFTTEAGETISNLKIQLERYGSPDLPAFLVCHAFGESGHVAGIYPEAVFANLPPLQKAGGRKGWWDFLIGPGQAINTEKFHVIAPNALGGAHGSSRPQISLTIRDMVRAHALLLQSLGVSKTWVTGGSLGGMQALEFAASFPELTAGMIAICAPAWQTTWGHEFYNLALTILERNPSALFEVLALIVASGRTAAEVEARLEREQRPGALTRVVEGFASKMDSQTAGLFLKAALSHDLRPARHLEAFFQRQSFPAIMASIASDQLYTPAEIQKQAEYVGARCLEIPSRFGHAAFLTDRSQTIQFYREVLE